MNERLTTFFQDFFGIDVSARPAPDFPTFEEVLGILELAIQRAEGFRGYTIDQDNSELQRLRQDLIFMIALALHRKLNQEHGLHGYHRLLVQRLRAEGALSRTAFVSLNYDILIDNALLRMHPGYDVDHGVDFANYQLDQPDWQPPQPGRGVPLLKLHGSLSWLYCPVCLSLTHTPRTKGVVELAFRPIPCVKCGSNSVPIIIPPTFFKVMSNFHLQLVWRRAEECFQQASTVYFCGYSFPDADIHIKYMLKRAELRRAAPLKVFVINNHTDKTDDARSSERRRYERFFKNKADVNYIGLSFQEFATKGA